MSGILYGDEQNQPTNGLHLGSAYLQVKVQTAAYSPVCVWLIPSRLDIRQHAGFMAGQMSDHLPEIWHAFALTNKIKNESAKPYKACHVRAHLRPAEVLITSSPFGLVLLVKGTMPTASLSWF
jgi:hypothetical protein